jgi:hypothetical protein
VWKFDAPAAGQPAAHVQLTTEQAWRLLTNNLVPQLHGQPVSSGDDELVAVLLRTRAIIGEPI